MKAMVHEIAQNEQARLTAETALRQAHARADTAESQIEDANRRVQDIESYLAREREKNHDLSNDLANLKQATNVVLGDLHSMESSQQEAHSEVILIIDIISKFKKTNQTIFIWCFLFMFIMFRWMRRLLMLMQEN